jgi:hypothetical protein
MLRQQSRFKHSLIHNFTLFFYINSHVTVVEKIVWKRGTILKNIGFFFKKKY